MGLEEGIGRVIEDEHVGLQTQTLPWCRRCGLPACAHLHLYMYSCLDQSLTLSNLSHMRMLSVFSYLCHAYVHAVASAKDMYTYGIRIYTMVHVHIHTYLCVNKFAYKYAK